MGFATVKYREQRWKFWRKPNEVFCYVQDVDNPAYYTEVAIDRHMRYGAHALTRLYIRRVLWWMVLVAGAVVWIVSFMNGIHHRGNRDLAVFVVIIIPSLLITFLAGIDPRDSCASRIRRAKSLRYFVWPTAALPSTDLRIEMLYSAITTARQTYTHASAESFEKWLANAPYAVYQMMDAYLRGTEHFMRTIERRDEKHVAYRAAIEQMELAADEVAHAVCAQYLFLHGVSDATVLIGKQASVVIGRLEAIEDIDPEEQAERKERWSNAPVIP